MDLKIKSGSHKFYIGESEKEAVAVIAYKPEPNNNTIVAYSTYVDPSLRGQNIAKQLLDRLAEYARENNLKILPTCSYVVKAFDRFDRYDDVKVSQ